LLSRDLPNIIFADLQDGGKIGDWKTSDTEFPLGVHHSACIYKNHLYIPKIRKLIAEKAVKLIHKGKLPERKEALKFHVKVLK
jgi:hypothetical protein